MRTEEFSFEVFNEDVRTHLAENAEHPEYSDFWGQRRTFTVLAHSPDDAKQKISKKYPEDKGFVTTLK